MTKLMKFPCAFAVAALLVSGAIPASADSFSIFGGGHRDREDRVQQGVVVTGAPIVAEPVVVAPVVAPPVATVVSPGTVTYTTYSSYDPYYEQNYQYDDREGYRYYHNQDGHVLGRVLHDVIGRPHSH